MKRVTIVLSLAILAGAGWPSNLLADRERPTHALERLETSTHPKTVAFRGTVRRGETFSHKITDHLTFLLVPEEHGWRIDVRDDRLKIGLTRLTPPFHGVNPIYVEGWHFRNTDNTAANTGDVNAPQKNREFIFSSKFEQAVESGDESYWTSPEQVCEAARDGHARLVISDLSLGNLVRGEHAWIEEMRFKVKIELGDSKYNYLSFCRK